MEYFKLDNCPFCGEYGKIVIGVDASIIPYRSYAFCKCESCDARTKVFSCHDDSISFIIKAIESWNNRMEKNN